MTKKHSPEIIEAARKLYETGIGLQTVAIQVKVPYGTLYYHACVQGWGRGHGEQESKRTVRRIQRQLKREEVQIGKQQAIEKAQEVEVLARKSLAADSARTKLAVSRQVGKILSGLEEDTMMSLRDRARTLNALGPVIKLLHRWDEEVEVEDIRQTKGAINLALIATRPEELRKLGEGRAPTG